MLDAIQFCKDKRGNVVFIIDIFNIMHAQIALRFDR